MKEKRNYITPDVAIEAWLGKECWLFSNISDGTDPAFAPERREKAF